MITKEKYLEALTIVEAYHKQLNLAVVRHCGNDNDISKLNKGNMEARIELITGKNLERFEEWLISQDFWDEQYDYREQHFVSLIGVILSYYDSIRINIYLLNGNYSKYRWNVRYKNKMCYKRGDEVARFTYSETPTEAYKAAFKKANEIANNTK